jgi:hypothetical protein
LLQGHLGEVVFVELPDNGASVLAGGSFGNVESVKATSDVNSPIAGEVVEVNSKLTETPGLVSPLTSIVHPLFSQSLDKLYSLTFFLCRNVTKLPDQLEPLRGRVDDQGEAEQLWGPGQSAGRRHVHQALRGGRRSLEHGRNDFGGINRRPIFWFFFFLFRCKIRIMPPVFNNNQTSALSGMFFLPVVSSLSSITI